MRKLRKSQHRQISPRYAIILEFQLLARVKRIVPILQTGARSGCRKSRLERSELPMARQARQSRQQLICVLADNSGSMAGEKAKAATAGIREMIMECQSRGPAGPERSYFKFLLIRFGDNAVVDPSCDLTAVRKIDPDQISVEGNGGQTNITDALQLTLDRLRPYMQSLEEHSERAEHPIPLVILFSDGEHNKGPAPQPVASQIKNLSLDAEPVVIAAAGISTGGESLDERTLREIASPECYVHISDAQVLSRFIASVGSSGVSRAKEVAEVIKNLEF
jgi:uncharacterized protein YegL